MARFHFSLEPLLEARRSAEEERRTEMEQAEQAFYRAARDRAVLERLELRRREAWLVRERRRAE
jgi:hypothetical protein